MGRTLMYSQLFQAVRLHNEALVPNGNHVAVRDLVWVTHRAIDLVANIQ